MSDCFLSLFVRKKLLVASCRYAKVCKRDCYKGIFKKFMARKPGIHGHKQLLPYKSWYNYPNHLSIKLTQNNKEALSNDNNRHRKTKKAKT